MIDMTLTIDKISFIDKRSHIENSSLRDKILYIHSSPRGNRLSRDHQDIR